MKIREKLLIVLIVVSVAPLVVLFAVHSSSMARTSEATAGRMRQSLLDDATVYLCTVVEDFAGFVDRDMLSMELILSQQAGEVERRLAEPPPADPVVHYCREYDRPDPDIKGLVELPKYQKLVNGKSVPLPVTFDEQVFFIAEGNDVDAVRLSQDAARLSTMTGVYRELYNKKPDALTILYTGMESGLHNCYPGHGGYPADYDPRKREWYKRAQKADRLIWTVMPSVSTRKVELTASMPVHRPDGSLAGVTALDATLASVLDTIHLPQKWHKDAIVMQVIPVDSTSEMKTDLERLQILAQESYVAEGEKWQSDVDWQYLDVDKDTLRKILADMTAGRSGVLRMDYRGADSLLAYGPWRAGRPVALVIVPFDTIAAEAIQSEAFIREQEMERLHTGGYVLGGALVVCILIAAMVSAAIARPVRKLSGAAEKLAEGDFDIRVDVNRSDEIGDLCRTFNHVGPALRENEKMKQSLALAREIQQNLLPRSVPKIEGFELAGRSIPCDEIGGDFYDFIKIVELGPERVGIALGDVTGHGIAAALLMASARSALRSQVSMHKTDLETIFKRVNADFLRDAASNRFITMFFGILDGPARELRWISGGQDPAIRLQRKDLAVSEVSVTGGMPLGIIEEAVFEKGEPIHMAPGDMLLIGTDGIWEAFGPDHEQFGKERLMAVLKEHADSSAEQICQTVIEAVTAFRGPAPQTDDITLIVIKAL